MKKLQFGILIQAPRRAVWETMLGPETYKKWTAPFMEGSYYEGSWEQGERIRFLGPGGSGGMTAVIAENRPHEYLSIKHLGVVKDGVDDTESDEVKSWAPAFENYHLADEAGGTRLRVELDITDEFEQYMNDTWPLALSALKSLCESTRK